MAAGYHGACRGATAPAARQNQDGVKQSPLWSDRRRSQSSRQARDRAQRCLWWPDTAPGLCPDTTATPPFILHSEAQRWRQAGTEPCAKSSLDMGLRFASTQVTPMDPMVDSADFRNASRRTHQQSTGQEVPLPVRAGQPVGHYQPVLNQWLPRRPNGHRIRALARPKRETDEPPPPFVGTSSWAIDEERLKALAAPKADKAGPESSLPASADTGARHRAVDFDRLNALAEPRVAKPAAEVGSQLVFRHGAHSRRHD